MRKVKILIVIVSFLLEGSVTFPQSLGSFKPLSEPDGFRGIKWGTDLSNLSDMVQVRAEDNNIRICTRRGDELRIEKAKLERIEYIFWMNKFYQVYINLRSAQNWNYFKEAIFETFGKPPSLLEIGKMLGAKEAQGVGESYLWDGQKTSMMINYDRNKQLGDLIMTSVIIDDQKKVYEEQKRIKQELETTKKKAREKGF